ncbi:hypothetical protein WJX73_005673 [Symbiochloris irregularis]|uniref:rRNA adenine N(6)-methyltransferase n=1 Tax=Symbiochloris irregularis TaxID=706552 RepID=A0AAW1NNP3_9CHLO
MTDENTLAKIVATVEAGEDDLFLEIGPGRGALTRHLLQAGSTVLAVEKDTALAARLKGKLSSSSARFEVMEGDILQADIPALLQQLNSLHDGSQRSSDHSPHRQARVVANLPFNITTEVIHMLLRLGDHISQVHLLLEDDTAKRLVKTQPGDPKYRAINVLVQYYATPLYHFRVPRTVFHPRPHVDAALTSFTLRPSSERPLASWNLPLTEAGDGLQASISAAGILGTLPLNQQLAVFRSHQYTLLALFHAQSHHCAQICSRELVQVFQKSLRLSGGHTEEAVRTSFSALLHELPADLQESAQGSILCLEHRTKRLTVASRGGCACSVSKLEHGLAAQYAGGRFLSEPARDYITCQGEPHKGEFPVQSQTGRQLSNAVTVSQLQLDPRHELICVGSPQLWRVLDKDDVALRGHFHVRANFQGNEQAVDPSSPNASMTHSRLPNTAQYLVTYAHDKSGCRHGPCYMRPTGADNVALALTLRWPTTSINQAFARSELAKAMRDPTMSPAARRWRRIKALHIECLHARRQMLTRKWQELVSQELKAGQKRAHEVEIRAWREQGEVLHMSPSLKVVNQNNGKILPPVINLQAWTNEE